MSMRAKDNEKVDDAVTARLRQIADANPEIPVEIGGGLSACLLDIEALAMPPCPVVDAAARAAANSAGLSPDEIDDMLGPDEATRAEQPTDADEGGFVADREPGESDDDYRARVAHVRRLFPDDP